MSEVGLSSTGCFDWKRGFAKPLTGMINQQVPVNDSLLVQELNELSVKEREHVYNEVHGVASVFPVESPEVVQSCCQELLVELGKVSKKKRRWYERAVFLKPSLECDTKFQLMFLRSERYDATRAAHRICTYFANKLELFGDEKLVKDITYDDLDEGDIEALNSGATCILPNRDQAGRPVLICDARFLKYKVWQNSLRSFWYLMMNECTDDLSQRSGVVDIAYTVDMNGTPPHIMEIIGNGSAIWFNTLPVRFVSVHFCFNKSTFSPMVSLFQMALGTQNRVRFRGHFGSNLEAQYELLTFGVRVPEFLLHETGDDRKRREMMKKYSAVRKEIEKKAAMEEHASIPEGLCALYPGPKDVLLGRGRPFQSFIGNQRLTELMDEYRDRYLDCTSRVEKTFVAMAIVQHIQDEGGRFVERIDSKGWKLVNNERARGKVSQALRKRILRQEASTSSGAMTVNTSDESDGGEMDRVIKRMRVEPTPESNENGMDWFGWD